ncbi:hypothetical protein K438DRAFT_2047895 [Mycena galopus ATCC 62051]|nr:hypothetical protein K438DRAFT_2047895 [Mycena galopus ATCC 62051]
MRSPPSTFFAILATLVMFTLVSFANWAPDKAAQINFFADARCSAYNGEVAAWWTLSPLVGGIGNEAAIAQCFNLSTPSNSLGIATVNMWLQVSGTTTEPPASIGQCTFWDDYGCSGNGDSSDYVPPYGACLPASSTDGELWKSAKCWNNGTSPSSSTSVARNGSSASLPALSSEASSSTTSVAGLGRSTALSSETPDPSTSVAGSGTPANAFKFRHKLGGQEQFNLPPSSGTPRTKGANTDGIGRGDHRGLDHLAVGFGCCIDLPTPTPTAARRGPAGGYHSAIYWSRNSSRGLERAPTTAGESTHRRTRENGLSRGSGDMRDTGGDGRFDGAWNFAPDIGKGPGAKGASEGGWIAGRGGTAPSCSRANQYASCSDERDRGEHRTSAAICVGGESVTSWNRGQYMDENLIYHSNAFVVGGSCSRYERNLETTWRHPHPGSLTLGQVFKAQQQEQQGIRRFEQETEANREP